MRMVKQITDNKYLNIKEVYHPEKNCKGYQFAERKGKDSVAFICMDKTGHSGEFLLNREFTPPTDEFLFRAFGGSFDKSKEPIDIVIDEVSEEVGYIVKNKNVHFVGNAFVSTQMNQYCYLFLVDITGAKMDGRKPENKMEAMAEPTWMQKQNIISNSDWKAITIVCKAKEMGLID